MKRLFILVAAIFSLSAASFASDGEYAFLSKLTEKEKFDGLANYLQADFEQQRYLKEIFALSNKKLEAASVDGVISNEDLQKALAFNLANTKSVLSREQYKKYLIMLNITTNNSKSGEFLAEK